MTSAHAFIAFLRTEADQAEERARHLRTTAAAIEANSFTSASCDVGRVAELLLFEILSQSIYLLPVLIAQQAARRDEGRIQQRNGLPQLTLSLYRRTMSSLGELMIRTWRAKTSLP